MKNVITMIGHKLVLVQQLMADASQWVMVDVKQWFITFNNVRFTFKLGGVTNECL
jgi:hypothetical protein